jgi:hypothetical protein
VRQKGLTVSLQIIGSIMLLNTKVNTLEKLQEFDTRFCAKNTSPQPSVVSHAICSVIVQWAK